MFPIDGQYGFQMLFRDLVYRIHLFNVFTGIVHVDDIVNPDSLSENFQ